LPGQPIVVRITLILAALCEQTVGVGKPPIGAEPTHVINYTQEDFTQGGLRYELILDNVGNHSVPECRRALTPYGTLLPNSGSGGRWLDGLPRMAGALVLSPFVRQRLRSFVPAGKGKDLVAGRPVLDGGERYLVECDDPAGNRIGLAVPVRRRTQTQTLVAVRDVEASSRWY